MEGFIIEYTIMRFYEWGKNLKGSWVNKKWKGFTVQCTYKWIQNDKGRQNGNVLWVNTKW